MKTNKTLASPFFPYLIKKKKNLALSCVNLISIILISMRQKSLVEYVSASGCIWDHS